jgi:hypothetical protein
MRDETMPHAWTTAPADGSLIGIRFPDGTEALASFDSGGRAWDVLRRNGSWVRMAYDHGTQQPVEWWPADSVHH